MKPYVTPQLNLKTIEHHFDELVHTWSLRWYALTSLEWHLDELSQLESRVCAHRDALLLVGGRIVSLVASCLDPRDDEEAAAALLLFADLDDPAPVVQAIQLADASRLVGFRRSLPYSKPSVKLIDALHALCQARGPVQRALAGYILACFGHAPYCNWTEEMVEATPEERRLWLCIAAQARVSDEWIQRYCEDSDKGVRETAFWLLATRGSAILLNWCRKLAHSSCPARLEAIRYLGVLDPTTEFRTLANFLEHDLDAPVALDALGIAGMPESVPVLLDALSDKHLATTAFRSLQRVTHWEDMPGTQISTPPESMDETELEFWEPEFLPDVSRVRQRWEQDRKHYRQGVPHQLGKAVTDPAVLTMNMPLAVCRDLFLRFRRSRPDWLPGYDPQQWASIQRAHLNMVRS